MIDFPSKLQHGSGETLSIDHTRRLLAIKESSSPGQIAKKLADTGFVLEDSGRGTPPAARINHTDRRFWIRSADGAGADENADRRLKEKLGDTLDWIGPVYRSPRERGRAAFVCPLPNVLLVKPPRSVKMTERTIGNAMKSRLAADDPKPVLKEVKEKSKYLNGFRYFEIEPPLRTSSYRLRAQLAKQANDSGMDIRFENMPMLVPSALSPNDPMFAQQWNMNQIQAPDGWDISTGAASVVVCILDEGCDLTHPDLEFAADGINLGSMSGDGSPTGNHGTPCAGIAAATINNAAGVAGVAGDCEILPLAFQSWSDVEVAAGITYATDNGAQVISMSFGWNLWDPAIIDPAVQYAFDTDLVMCVATHNHNGAITYPATNPLVMACGASDQIDNRKTPASPDGETWGSNFGPAMSVVAPGVIIATTDRQGTVGYNVDGSGGTFGGVFYPSLGDPAGDYVSVFNGTSAATPHVAGLAGLIRSAYPALTNVEVRAIIERTADKVGAVPYAETGGYNNGTWNDEMGYGRINVSRALDFSNLMIRDWPGDVGNEPSAPGGGNFWSFSDVVVRITDDDVFVPGDPTQSKHLEIGQTNYLYVRVRNNGPREARNIVVNARLTPFVGTQFVYPHDWTSVDATHLSPTPISASFATIPPGGEEIAKFSISAAQVDILHNENWHPCVVVSASADNDYAFQTAAFTDNPIVVRRSNLAQRNLSLINVLPDASAAFPFVAGHVLNPDRAVELVVDRSRLPADMPLMLALDEGNRYFPRVDFKPAREQDTCQPGWEFMEKTRIRTRVGCCDGVLTLAGGSKFECPPKLNVGEVSVTGGELILRDGQRLVEIRESKAVIRMETTPHQAYPLILRAKVPATAGAGDEYPVNITQRNAGREVVGGAGAIFRVAAE